MFWSDSARLHRFQKNCDLLRTGKVAELEMMSPPPEVPDLDKRMSEVLALARFMEIPCLELEVNALVSPAKQAFEALWCLRRGFFFSTIPRPLSLFCGSLVVCAKWDRAMCTGGLCSTSGYRELILRIAWFACLLQRFSSSPPGHWRTQHRRPWSCKRSVTV